MDDGEHSLKKDEDYVFIAKLIIICGNDGQQRERILLQKKKLKEGSSKDNKCSPA